jgi:beta-phosphoglucomutase family hydrolase
VSARATTLRPRLPSAVRACLFDLDGVLTKTAVVHAAAWKEMFDTFLRTAPGPFVPFDATHDYDRYVDGKARSDGVRSFLESRGIRLPEGGADDPPDAETVHGLGNRKNALVLELIRRQGVEPYEDAVVFVHAVRDAGLATAVVSSSANCREVVHAAGMDDLFDTRVDALVAAELSLAGKPAPDMFLAAARRLGVQPAAATVFEDALAGVEAGHAGGFALVVGVDRVGQADALRAHGADVVVQALTELLDER